MLDIARDKQNPRIPFHRGVTAGPVVLRQRVPRRVERHAIRVKTGLLQILGKGEEVFARLQLDLLLAEKLVVLIKPQDRGFLLVRMGENLDVEGLPLLHLRRQTQFLHRHIVAPRRAERQNINRHPERSRRKDGGLGVPGGLVPVREQHQPLLAGFGKRRRGQAHRRPDVGSLRIHHRQHFFEFQRDIWRGLNRRVRPEHHHPRAIFPMLALRGPVDEVPRLLLGRLRHAQ